jgi:hypothetical protein
MFQLVTELRLQSKYTMVGFSVAGSIAILIRALHNQFSGNQSSIGKSGEEFEKGIESISSTIRNVVFKILMCRTIHIDSALPRFLFLVFFDCKNLLTPLLLFNNFFHKIHLFLVKYF